MPDWEEFYNRFREPDFISGYEIQHRLGGGAFGEVFKARKYSIGKPYAIKFLRLDEASQRDVVERELDQVRLFAAIDHPHLVTIEDMGVVLGVPFLIMGYAGEETLARRLQRGTLARDQGMRLFIQACRGVLALHDRRLAHFDLKPSNIFLKGDVARVGDYGLAKLLADGRRTLSFGRGTPHYMAPEMLRNRGDQRADIYSLGVILYESMAGKLPYADDESGLATFMREDDNPPTFPPDFPPELRHIVERCLRFDPGDRYSTVNELLEDMGQTARQGDSVTIPWDLPGTPRPQEERRNAGAQAATPTAAGDELRTAASELARGAVEVARGMWDGVRGTKKAPATEATPGAPAENPTPTPRAAASDDIVSFETLSDEVVEDTEVPANGLPDDDSARARRGVLGILDRVRQDGEFREAPLTPEVEDEPLERAINEEWKQHEPVLPKKPVEPSGAATVPVPPRAEGGVLGAALSSLVLGVEIMIAIVSGPITAVGRGLGRSADRLVRRVPGFLGRILRLGFFMLFFFVVGAVMTFAALVAFEL